MTSLCRKSGIIWQVSFWHFSDLPGEADEVRSSGQSGSRRRARRRLKMTHKRHRDDASSSSLSVARPQPTRRECHAALKAAGGRVLAPPEGKTVALVREAPKRVGITEWDSVEQARAFRNPEAYKNLAMQRDKALKPIRTYVKEAAAN